VYTIKHRKIRFDQTFYSTIRIGARILDGIENTHRRPRFKLNEH
jgi:hypothetical protein